jgi:Kdo2-lipid IVA lauroyltransferase/acyltransferase
MKKTKKFKKKIKRLIYPLGTWLFLLLGLVVRRLNRNQCLRLSRILGNFIYDYLRIRRWLVLDNLSRTFPRKSSQEIDRIARRVYQNQILNLFELLRIPLIRDKSDAQKFVKLYAEESFYQAMSNNTGAVVVSGHFGSWETIGVCTGLILKPMNFIAKPIKNQRLDYYLNQLRALHGNKVIQKDKALREGMKALKNGEILAILADQSQRKVSRYVEFLGRQSSVFLGPAFLALKAGVPLFVEVSRRTENHDYHVEIKKVQTSDLECRKEDIVELVKRYLKELEDFIIKHPEEWLWLHDRWKRSPRAQT